MVFPVVMYGCESWTIKKAEHRRMDAFELWCWRRLLRVPWTTRRSNQSILKEIIPEYSMEGLVLKVKLQIFGRLMWRTDSLEKTLMGCWERLKSGRERDDRGWNGWMGSPTQWTWVWAISGSWWWTGRAGLLQLQRVRYNWVTELNWSHLDNVAYQITLYQFRHRSISLGSFLFFPYRGHKISVKEIDNLNKMYKDATCSRLIQHILKTVHIRNLLTIIKRIHHNWFNHQNPKMKKTSPCLIDMFLISTTGSSLSSFSSLPSFFFNN